MVQVVETYIGLKQLNLLVVETQLQNHVHRFLLGHIEGTTTSTTKNLQQNIAQEVVGASFPPLCKG